MYYFLCILCNCMRYKDLSYCQYILQIAFRMLSFNFYTHFTMKDFTGKDFTSKLASTGDCD